MAKQSLKSRLFGVPHGKANVILIVTIFRSDKLNILFDSKETSVGRKTNKSSNFN